MEEDWELGAAEVWVVSLVRGVDTPSKYWLAVGLGWLTIGR